MFVVVHELELDTGSSGDVIRPLIASFVKVADIGAVVGLTCHFFRLRGLGLQGITVKAWIRGLESNEVVGPFGGLRGHSGFLVLDTHILLSALAREKWV